MNLHAILSQCKGNRQYKDGRHNSALPSAAFPSFYLGVGHLARDQTGSSNPDHAVIIYRILDRLDAEKDISLAMKIKFHGEENGNRKQQTYPIMVFVRRVFPDPSHYEERDFFPRADLKRKHSKKQHTHP